MDGSPEDGRPQDGQAARDLASGRSVFFERRKEGYGSIKAEGRGTISSKVKDFWFMTKAVRIHKRENAVMTMDIKSFLSVASPLNEVANDIRSLWSLYISFSCSLGLRWKKYKEKQLLARAKAIGYRKQESWKACDLIYDLLQLSNQPNRQ